MITSLAKSRPFVNIPDPKLSDEPARLAALHRYQVLDTPAEEPFDKLTALVRSLLDIPICAVSLIDSERQWFKSSHGFDMTQGLQMQMPRCHSFCTHAILQSAPFIIEDARSDHRFRDNPMVLGNPHIGSYAGVPLRTPDGYNIGALCAIDTSPRVFETGHIELLKKFAGLVVDELELRQAAQKDFLTGVMSRRAFTNEAERQIRLYRQHGRSNALIMFDVDHFKSVNDRYGHLAGDAVLTEIVKRTAAEIGSNDCIGRLGGEEFGILVSDVGQEAAFGLAERVRIALAAQPFALEQPVTITASFGVAGLTDAMANPAKWFAPTDAALYRAKNQGRNCCVLG